MINSQHFTHTGKLRNMASVYLRKGDQILLLYRQGSSIVSNLWIGSAGGHFEHGELNDAKACILRELSEELDLKENSLANLTLRYVTMRYFDGELRQNYYFFAEIEDSPESCLESNEGITQWFYLNELKDLPMPFTARHMIDHYLEKGQFNCMLYGGIANNDGVTFIPL